MRSKSCNYFQNLMSSLLSFLTDFRQNKTSSRAARAQRDDMLLKMDSTDIRSTEMSHLNLRAAKNWNYPQFSSTVATQPDFVWH